MYVFKVLVVYDFSLVRYACNMNYTSPLNTVLISDAQKSEIPKYKDLPIMSKQDCFAEVLLK